MYISYDYYRIFYYVAKYGNISQAAKILMSSQPNLTRAIKNLETSLGCSLFTRTNRGMKLTPEGEKLYSHILIAFEHIENGEEEIMQSKNLENGVIFIAASEVALRCCLLPVLKKYRTMYPGIKIRISNHTTNQAIASLKEGIADIAVVTTPTVKSDSLTQTVIREIQEVAVCSKAFSELENKEVSLKSIQDYPLISLNEDSKTFEMYSSFFAKYGLHFFADIEASSADQILPMVRSDLGIGFIPEEFVNDCSDIIKLNLKEKIPSRNICMIKRKDQSLSVAAKELERLLLNNNI